MDLRQKANEESDRLSNLLLGFAVAAIAFGAHEVGEWDPSKAAAGAAIAGSIWAGSFLCGLYRAHEIYRAIRINAYLEENQQQNQRRSDAEAAFDKVNRRAGKLYEWQRRLLFAGALTFAGAVAIHIQEKSDGANTRRCLAIQRDMLSSSPKRSDDIELFEVLGCKPSGEGSVYARRPAEKKPIQPR